ncbi:MAG: ComF family protein [Chloroflexi bacterium]|nr:ComF family protein [Chloroflexota bacterium]
MTDKLQDSSVSRHYCIKNAKNAILNFFLPPVCASCGKVGTIICDECLHHVQPVFSPVYSNVKEPRNLNPGTKHERNPLQSVWAATIFSGPIPDAIHKLKYNGQFALAKPLGMLMTESWLSRPNPKIDVVVPIPLHPQRKKERGYNQSALLVKYFCEGVSFPYNMDILRRVKYTSPQVGLNAKSRSSNVEGAFWANSGSVAGKQVLLVDDVFTTGATMRAAANALFTAGASSIFGYCLAYAE